METKKLPTIDIKGKEYVMVKDRLIYFNENYKERSIETQILRDDATSVVAKAIIKSDAGTFTGHSEAYREGNMSQVPVEVAETSAVGRALAMMGIGIIESVASADEVNKASGSPKTAPRQPVAHNRGVSHAPESSAVTCKGCGNPAKRSKSQSSANPNRAFYACPQPKASQCYPSFLGWEDELLVKQDDDTAYDNDEANLEASNAFLRYDND